jgi:hypothetical protein
MRLEILQRIHVKWESLGIVPGIVFSYGLSDVFNRLFLEVAIHGFTKSEIQSEAPFFLCATILQKTERRSFFPRSSKNAIQ